MMIRLCRGKRRQQGSAIVETAIFFIFLVFLTFAIIQFSLIMNAQLTVQNLARSGARYACVHFKDSGFGTSNIQNYIDSTVGTSGSTVPGSSTTMTYYPEGTAALDNGTVPAATSITVEIQYNMSKKYLFNGFIPGLPQNWTYTYYFTTFPEGQ